MKGEQKLYLDLMKKCLTNWIYGDFEYHNIKPQKFWKRKIYDFLKSRGITMVKLTPMDQAVRTLGKDWPQYAHTMIGMKRLDNIQLCAEDIICHNIVGDFIEAGVWRGGATIFMRAILKAYGIKNKTVWVADSFKGCPPPDRKRYPQDTEGLQFYRYEELGVSLDCVKSNFERYGLLDEQVCFLEGWFKDTLPNAPIEKLALIRLDGDLYESIMDSLVNLYPKLSLGGYIIVDDFNLYPNCRQAVLDYRKQNNIEDKIINVDWSAVYWKRTR